MSSYATLTDLATVGLPASALQGIFPTDQQAVLDDASDLADSYLRSRFTLPLATWGRDLRRAVCLIAAYDLMVRRGYTAEAADENIRMRYEDAIRWLEGVRDGRNTPAATTTSPDANPSAQVGQHVAGSGGGDTLTPSGWVIGGSPSRGW